MVKVSELSGALLDYWVARAEGHTAIVNGGICYVGINAVSVQQVNGYVPHYSPSTDWAAGGVIIERERIALFQTFHEGHTYFSEERRWTAWTNGAMYETEVSGDAEGVGPTQLGAAMRAFVASKFGEEVKDEGV